MKKQLTFKLFGERAILISWEAKICEHILKDILLFKAKIANTKSELLVDMIIGYNSLTLLYKSPLTNFLAEKEVLQILYKNLDIEEKNRNYLWEIPVCYDTNFGIDLEELAIRSNMSTEKIIQLHAKEYTVFFIGFLPGFLYLGGLDRNLHFDRKPNPRLKVAKGSVAIGGQQTGIYPMESAGGWNIIGKTPINFFNINNQNPCFAKSGDRIKFIPISLEQYFKIEEKVSTIKCQISKILIND